MSKDRVLEELRRVIEGRTGKTSEIVREFKTCPQFRQCCQLLSRAVQHGTYGRRPALKTPSGLAPPARSAEVTPWRCPALTVFHFSTVRSAATPERRALLASSSISASRH